MNWLRRAVLNWIFSARYEGATWSPSRTWTPHDYTDAHIDLNKATRATLAGKVREFEKNDGIVQKSADLSEQFVAGPGGMPVLAASSDSRWNVAAQAWWDKWCNFADLTSRQSFGTLQSQWVRQAEIDGETFILKTTGEQWFPRLQTIEGHRIETPPKMSDSEGKFPGIIDGVSVNEIGRPTQYWLRTGDGASATYRPIDAAAVIHYFEPSRPGQYRGLTPWHAAINDLIDLKDLQDLEMRAAKDAAEISNVVNTESGELDIGSLRRELSSGSNQNSAGATVTENRAQQVRDAIGGRTLALRVGEKLEQFRSARPSVTTQEYWDFLIGKICAARGVSKLLAFPYGRVQGTLVRAELDIAAGFYRCRSAILQDVLRQIWIYVMGTAIRNEPSLRSAPKDWDRVVIIPPRAPNVDVGYNSAAMIAEWKAGLRTMASVLAPLGLNPSDVMRTRAREVAERNSLAIEYDVEPEEIANPSEIVPTAEEPAPEETVP